VDGGRIYQVCQGMQIVPVYLNPQAAQETFYMGVCIKLRFLNDKPEERMRAERFAD